MYIKHCKLSKNKRLELMNISLKMQQKDFNEQFSGTVGA
jgi:hypothetical protein